MTTFADARVSAVKQRGKRGNLHEAMGRAFPAWAANAAHIQLATRGKNFWKSSGVIGPAVTIMGEQRDRLRLNFTRSELCVPETHVWTAPAVQERI